LAKAWERYKTGKGGKPRFKSARDTNDTLINEDAKNITVERVSDRDAFIRIPRLGVFRVKHLWEDWGDTVISVLKVAKRPDGYYLQLTGQVEEKPLKATDKECRITAPDKPCDLLGTTDVGKPLLAYAPCPKLLKRKELLQQQLSRQVYLSKNWHKTKRKIGRIEKRLAEQAKNYNHKISTFLVRTYSKIDTGDVGKRKVLKKPQPKRRPKTFEPMLFDPNGATAIAEYNKHLLSQRTGQFVALIKQKEKAR
jgi:putative transposase